MARTQEYIITIRTEATSETQSSKAAPPSATTQNGSKITQSSSKSAGQNLTKGIIRSAAYGYAKKALGVAAEATVGTIQLRTGQKQYQERQQAIYSYVQSGIGIAESMAMGFAVGNLPGAVISGVASSLFKVVNIGIESRQLGLSKTVDDIGKEQAAIRAGAGGGRMGKNY